VPATATAGAAGHHGPYRVCHLNGGGLVLSSFPICRTCGVQYEHGHDLAHCPICDDERQYVPPQGQQWTTQQQLAEQGFRTVLRQELHGLWGVGTEPRFAIGQRALLVPGEGGNLLWDCVSVINEDTVESIKALGGVSAIAISHPHYYSAMVEWSEAFGGVPIYLHERDAQWAARRGEMRFWSGEEIQVLPGRTLYRAGVHFAGGTILHWPGGADGRGALCTGDIIQVVEDTRWVSFMYSYPNLIPEHPDTITRAVNLVRPLDFEVIYGAWWGKVVTADAKGAVVRSAERYLRHIGL
jgi:glyoxylase-like metal-dependent hydrolase (beta-lactamase superfamily II)